MSCEFWMEKVISLLGHFSKLLSMNSVIESKVLNIERYFYCINDNICKMGNYENHWWASYSGAAGSSAWNGSVIYGRGLYKKNYRGFCCCFIQDYLNGLLPHSAQNFAKNMCTYIYIYKTHSDYIVLHLGI